MPGGSQSPPGYGNFAGHAPAAGKLAFGKKSCYSGATWGSELSLSGMDREALAGADGAALMIFPAATDVIDR